MLRPMPNVSVRSRIASGISSSTYLLGYVENHSDRFLCATRPRRASRSRGVETSISVSVRAQGSQCLNGGKNVQVKCLGVGCINRIRELLNLTDADGGRLRTFGSL